MRRIFLVAEFLFALGLLSPAADVSSCGGSFAASSEDVNAVNRFIRAVRALNESPDHIARLAELIRFPLRREYPLPGIHSPFEFLARYKEVFDERLVRRVMEWDGGCVNTFKYGLHLRDVVRFDKDGMVWRIDYESEVEKHERSRLIELHRNELHDSLQEYESPILDWETCTYRIRIDYVGDDTFRYASWKVGTAYGSKPDLIIDDGELFYEGTGLFRYYYFANGKYRYVIDGASAGMYRRPQPGFLRVYRADLSDEDMSRYGYRSLGSLWFDEQSDAPREPLLVEEIVSGDPGYWYVRTSACGGE
ncbi:MAG: hypothetical protein OXC31_16950 [Spirochaetaceae bacterium]|nr:hypothetical protein [Spirochaetaceae bacterium]